MYWKDEDIDKIHSRDRKDDIFYDVIAVLLIIYWLHLFLSL